MTQEEYLEFNIRCAEFLGWESLSPKTKYCYWKFPQELCFKLRHSEPVHSNNLIFHSDYNWIMEVVDRIESKNFENEAKNCISFLVKICNGNCQIVDLFKDRFEINIYAKTNKEAVVQAINQFLIWYNNEQRDKL